MPYIRSLTRRKGLETVAVPTDVGELTCALTIRVLQFLPAHPCFEDYAEALGALEATKLELYRRAIAPYEDRKIEENGDVYPSEVADHS